MALIVGHSQTRYLENFVNKDQTVVKCYPGFKIRDLSQEKGFLDIVPDVPISFSIFYISKD